MKFVLIVKNMGGLNDRQRKRKMKLTHRVSDRSGVHEYHLEISKDDFERLKLDQFDLKLMSECELSESISDKLLMLELLARRFEQQEAKGKENEEK